MSQTSVGAPAGEEYPSPAYAWYVVFVLYLAYTLSFIDRQIIAFLVGPIRQSLAITDFQFSLISGLAFAVFYTVMGVPLGWMADRYSRRGLMSIGVAVWSAMTVACGTASNYIQLFLARIGVGVGEATLGPAAYSVISDSFPKPRRALPISIYSAGVLCGAGLANVFGGLIVEYAIQAGPRELPLFGTVQPWQQAFIAVGLPGLLIALLVLSIREPSRKERASAAALPFSRTLAHLRAHWLVYLTLILGPTMFAMTNYALMSWIPAVYERSYGWNRAQVGPLFGGVIFVFGTIGLAAGGWLANRMAAAGVQAAYSKLMVYTQLVTLPPLALLMAVPDPWWTMGCIALVMLFLSAHVGLGPTALHSITPNEMRGQVIAVYFFVLNLVALGAGVPMVAALTDFYFRNDAAVGYSVVLVSTTASTLGILAILAGMRAYMRSAGQLAR